MNFNPGLGRKGANILMHGIRKPHDYDETDIKKWSVDTDYTVTICSGSSNEHLRKNLSIFILGAKFFLHFPGVKNTDVISSCGSSGLTRWQCESSKGAGVFAELSRHGPQTLHLHQNPSMCLWNVRIPGPPQINCVRVSGALNLHFDKAVQILQVLLCERTKSWKPLS